MWDMTKSSGMCIRIAWIERSKVKHEEPLSNFASNLK